MNHKIPDAYATLLVAISCFLAFTVAGCAKKAESEAAFASNQRQQLFLSCLSATDAGRSVADGAALVESCKQAANEFYPPMGAKQ